MTSDDSVASDETFDQKQRLVLLRLGREYNKEAERHTDEGRYDESMRLHRKRLKIEEDVYGCDDHRDMSATNWNIANVLHEQCMFKEAMKYY